ncbi:rCG21621 [Rattus norvegicus]|uniref:RCG21621 n=1 Tax=Rattus norvegicus TaxID=10116 RepID=A6J080_RAT|nr:rCG21621 [Rattus norvegicus]
MVQCGRPGMIEEKCSRTPHHRLALISSIQDSALPGAQGTSVLRHTKALPNMASLYPWPQSLQIQVFQLKKLQRQTMIGVLVSFGKVYRK